MLYFSKIGKRVINLESINFIVCDKYDSIINKPYGLVSFISDKNKYIRVEEDELSQLLQDIEYAGTLVKLQKREEKI